MQKSTAQSVFVNDCLKITILCRRRKLVLTKNGQSLFSGKGKRAQSPEGVALSTCAAVSAWTATISRCNRTRARPGPEHDHTIWSCCGPEISGPEHDVGQICWSCCGPETPAQCGIGASPALPTCPVVH